MTTRRQRQVAELLHEEISQLIQHGTRDPRLGFVTVTGVEVTADLRLARVYVTVLGDQEDAKSTLAGLASAANYFRHQLKQTISLRYIPELSFKIDNSLEQGMRIDKILDHLKTEEVDPQNASDETESTD